MVMLIQKIHVDLADTAGTERPRWRLTRSTGIRVLFGIVALIGFAYLAKKAFIDPFNGVDFKYLWAAGRIWSEGKNAYGPLYSTVFAENFSYAGYPWFYPPTWFFISVPLSMLPVIKAEFVWRCVNFGLILAALGLGFGILRKCRPQRELLTEFVILAAYVFCLQATSIVVSIGQTSVIPTLGLMLLALGTSYRRPTSGILGVVLLALKPQFAVAPVSLLFALGIGRREIVIGMILTLTACLPALLIGGPVETALGFWNDLKQYPDLPMLTIGFDQLFHRAASTQVSSISYAFLAALAAVFIGLVVRSRSHWHAALTPAEDRLRVLLLVGSAINFVFLPLHHYDAVMLLPVAVVCLCGVFRGRPLILLSLVLSFRPECITWLGALGGPYWDPVNLSSVAYVLLLVGAIYFLVDLLRDKSRDTGSSRFSAKLAKVQPNLASRLRGVGIARLMESRIKNPG